MKNNFPKVKIFITYKNRHKVLKSNILTPIQTGRAIANEVFTDMIGDDTGDNISKDNLKYNELTAQYWAWKNYDKIGNPDYIGFMHYRRHFLFDKYKNRPNKQWLPLSSWYLFDEINEDYITYLNDDKIYDDIKGIDCIVPKIYDYNNYIYKSLVEDWKHLYMQKIDIFYKLFEVVENLFPEYYDTTEKVKNGHHKYIANMFIMKKEMFFEYCNFLYTIEKEIDKEIDSTVFNEAELRFLGFCGEIILTIFILQKKVENHYLIEELDTSFILDTTYTKEIFPAFKNNNNVIAMSSSSEYIPYLSVCLKSLIENINENQNYDIIIFERNISEEQKILLQSLITRVNISLRFINPMSIISQYNLSFPSNYNLECYFRITAPIFLKNFDKVLFTDIDLIFKKDPSLLFKEDMSDYYIGACQDLMFTAFLNYPKSDWKDYAENELNLFNPYYYYNTGVILINIKKFNEDDISKKLLEIANSKQYRILEQDVINKFFKNKIKYIDTKWNFPVANDVYKNLIQYMPSQFKQKYIDDSQNPSIIHYAGGLKPWLNFKENLAYVWWSYARQTPFYEELLINLININKNQKQYIIFNNNVFSYNNRLERIFSIKNMITSTKKYKIITILGFKLKFRKDVKFIEQIFSIKNEKQYKVLRILGFKFKFKRK